MDVFGSMITLLNLIIIFANLLELNNTGSGFGILVFILGIILIAVRWNY